MLIQGKNQEFIGIAIDSIITSSSTVNSSELFYISDFFPNRWVPTLTSDDVADRIVSAIQKKEKLAIIPRYLQFMLCVKW